VPHLPAEALNFDRDAEDAQLASGLDGVEFGASITSIICIGDPEIEKQRPSQGRKAAKLGRPVRPNRFYRINTWQCSSGQNLPEAARQII
jgi:hypothetical protein